MWISLRKDDEICHLINVNKVLGVCRGAANEIVISSHDKSWSVQFDSADGVNSADAALQTTQDVQQSLVIIHMHFTTYLCTYTHSTASAVSHTNLVMSPVNNT